MPDLNDFYAFKMTSGGSSNDNSNNGVGCGAAIIVLSVIGWALCIIGKLFEQCYSLNYFVYDLSLRKRALNRLITIDYVLKKDYNTINYNFFDTSTSGFWSKVIEDVPTS